MKKSIHNHSEEVEFVKRILPDECSLNRLAGLFKVFGNSTRMKILYLLFESELCVCAITELTGMEQSAISHQLRILKDSRLVGNRREGKTIFYFLADDHVRTIIEQGYNHIAEVELEGVPSK